MSAFQSNRFSEVEEEAGKGITLIINHKEDIIPGEIITQSENMITLSNFKFNKSGGNIFLALWETMFIDIVERNTPKCESQTPSSR